MNPEWTKVLEDVGPTMARRLDRALHHEPGFTTIPVPTIGFSPLDCVHNAIIDRCRRSGVHLFNPTAIIGRLEAAQAWRNRED